MKVFLFALLWLTLGGLGWARPDYKYAYVTTDGVAIRSAPGQDQKVVATLARGTSVGLLERRSGWVQVVPLQAYVRSQDLVENKVGTQGAELLVEPRADATVLGRLQPDQTLEQVRRGEPFSMVEAPSNVRFWIAESSVTVRGLPIRPSDRASVDGFHLSASDLRKLVGLRKGGLRQLVLPTDKSAVPHLESVQSGRFGPSYSVKYQVGSEWYRVSAATDGMGGADLDEPRYLIHTALFGSVPVGPVNYRGYKDFMMLAPPLLDASTAEGKPFPLCVFFDCSPGLPEATIRKVLQSFRAARL